MTGEDLFGGLVAGAMIPVIGWRIWRGLKARRLPLYRTSVSPEDGRDKYVVLVVLHVAALALMAVIAADLLLGVRLFGR